MDHEHDWQPNGVGRRCLACRTEEYTITDEQIRTALGLAPEHELVQTVRPAIDRTGVHRLGSDTRA